MSTVAAIPGIIALIVCMRRGPARAFVDVYLPTLLLLPSYYHWEFTLHLGFADTAILPIAAFFVFQPVKWHWSICDVAIVAFAAVTICSEYENSSYSMAQNVAIHQVCNIILPYVLGKGLIQSRELSVDLARKVTLLLTVVAITSIYEFRMTQDFYKALPGLFFSDQFDSFATRRYNYTRIAGPFPHPILAGMMLMAAYRFARWLEWTDAWQGNVGGFPISKLRFCELAILGGSLMTISRGPWIGGIAAAIVIVICRARSKQLRALYILVLTIVAIPVYFAGKSYVSVERNAAASSTQETAAYRHELLEKYVAIAEERPTWGWGFTDKPDGGQAFPIVDGMTSIDNHYLLLTLEHGEYALALMIFILVWTPGRLLPFGLKRSRDDPTASLALTLAGIYIAFAVSIATAWLGGQTQPMLFLVAGWSEGLLLGPAVEMTARQVVARRTTYRFQRVMA